MRPDRGNRIGTNHGSCGASPSYDPIGPASSKYTPDAIRPALVLYRVSDDITEIINIVHVAADFDA